MNKLWNKKGDRIFNEEKDYFLNKIHCNESKLLLILLLFEKRWLKSSNKQMQGISPLSNIKLVYCEPI